MLTLDTPITLGANQYTRLVCVKGGWDLRTRSIEIVISLAREKDGETIIATRERDGEQYRILAPPIVASLELQDSIPPDPALAAVFQKHHELMEAIEAVIVSNQQLKDLTYQSGEEESSLSATFVASASPGKPEERDKPTKPAIESPK